MNFFSQCYKSEFEITLYTVSDIWDFLLKQTLAGLVTEENLSNGRVYPPLQTIRECSIQIATSIAEEVYRDKQASYYPEPEDKMEFIRDYVYSTDYECFVPETWQWKKPEEN